MPDQSQYLEDMANITYREYHTATLLQAAAHGVDPDTIESVHPIFIRQSRALSEAGLTIARRET